MPGFLTGDALADDARARGGWFVGHFLAAGDPRRTGDVEVKWGVHPAGDRNRGGFVANQTARTLSVVLAGRFRIRFRDPDRPTVAEVVELDRPGRYALWDRGVEHDWEAVTDCTVLTVRWPSVPRDQAAAAEG
jgi:hypothetical protein